MSSLADGKGWGTRLHFFDQPYGTSTLIPAMQKGHDRMVDFTPPADVLPHFARSRGRQIQQVSA